MHYDFKKKKSGLGRNERKALSWDPAYCYVEFSRSLLPSVPMAGISIHRLDLTLPPGDTSTCNLVVPGGLTAVGTNMLSKAFVICLISFILWLLWASAHENEAQLGGAGSTEMRRNLGWGLKCLQYVLNIKAGRIFVIQLLRCEMKIVTGSGLC